MSNKQKDHVDFHTKLSNKLKSKTSPSYKIEIFLSNKIKKQKTNKPILSEKTLKKLVDLEIKTFQGKKREIPHRKLTRLKKNIIRNRKRHRAQVKKEEDPIEDEHELKLFETPQNMLVKVESSLEKLNLSEEGVCRDKEVIKHSRNFRS